MIADLVGSVNKI